MRWPDFKTFDAATGFSSKAGFVLTEKQQQAVHECLQWHHNLNKLEVGCGKTVISTVVSLMSDVESTIVTVPPILIDGWTAWLKTVSERVVEYRGDPKERKLIDLGDPRWIVCSHDIFRRDFERLMQAVSRKVWVDLPQKDGSVKGQISRSAIREVILDEAHFAKNPASVLFKCFQKAVSGHNAYGQMLTGTPINKPLDAYSYIKIKSPSLYRNYGHFQNIHVAERDYFKQPKKWAHLDVLEVRLNMQSISGTKEEYHGYNLKPLFPNSHYSLDPEHQAFYERLVDEQLLELPDGMVIDASTSGKLRQAMQQVVVNWDHFTGDPSKRSALLDMLDLTIDEAEIFDKSKSKLIVWTKYRMTSAKLLKYCNDKGIKTVAAYSGVDSVASVKAFQEDENTRILVANPQSCGAGLNPQAVCWEALFAEIDTVPIYVRQAMGRIDRVGQKHIPRMRIAVARNTVQEGLYHDLIHNDDLVTRIEPTKKGIREMLLGRVPAERAKPG